MTVRSDIEEASPSPEGERASDKKYNQFWWRLMFELGIVALVLLVGVYAGT